MSGLDMYMMIQFAEVLANFYNKLVNEGVPKSDALELSIEFLRGIQGGTK